MQRAPKAFKYCSAFRPEGICSQRHRSIAGVLSGLSTMRKLAGKGFYNEEAGAKGLPLKAFANPEFFLIAVAVSQAFMSAQAQRLQFRAVS